MIPSAVRAGAMPNAVTSPANPNTKNWISAFAPTLVTADRKSSSGSERPEMRNIRRTASLLMVTSGFRGPPFAPIDGYAAATNTHANMPSRK